MRLKGQFFDDGWEVNLGVDIRIHFKMFWSSNVVVVGSFLRTIAC